MNISYEHVTDKGKHPTMRSQKSYQIRFLHWNPNSVTLKSIFSKKQDFPNPAQFEVFQDNTS